MASAFWRMASASAGALGAEHLGLAHSDGGGFLGEGFGDEYLAGGLLLGSGLIGLGEDEFFLGVEFGRLAGGFGGGGHRVGLLVGLELGRLFVRLGFLDLLDEVFLGERLGIGDGDFLLALGGGEGLGVLDLLLFLDHGLLDDHALADDFLDFLALLFDGFLRLDLLELGDAFAFDLFDHALALDTFEFHAIGALLVALGDEHLALFVLLGDGEFLVGGDAGDLGLAALLFGDLGGFGFLAGAHGFDLALLAGLGFLELALEFEDRLAGLDVLLFDDLFLVALDLVGKLRLLGGELGDLS
jgi:hypothetical protein